MKIAKKEQITVDKVINTTFPISRSSISSRSSRRRSSGGGSSSIYMQDNLELLKCVAVWTRTAGPHSL